MLRFRSVPVLLALPLLVLGCATSRPFDRSTEPGGRPLSPTTAGSVIITGDALSADPGRTVLDAVRKAMPQLHVSSWSQYSRCPNLELRGKDSVTGSSNPDVYVDGTRTVDTCPLVTIQAMDARRVDVRLVQHLLVVRVGQALRDLCEHRVRAGRQSRNLGTAYLGPGFHALH